jgi:small-conductance mechanosensitive channel
VDVREKQQLDMAGQVTKARARARPWRSIIALILAVAAAAVSYGAGAGVSSLSESGRHTRTVMIVAGAVLFGLFAVLATVGFSGKIRDMLEPRIGSAHAAVIRYALVFAGGLISIIITLELLKIGVKQLILGGAFTAVLVGIAAQQTLSNVFAGIVLLFARPFAVGDEVRMRGGVVSGQIEGIVTEIGITYVRLDTDEGKLNVPNSQVLAAAVGPLKHSRAAPAAQSTHSAPTATGASAAAASAVPAPAAAGAPPAASAPPSDGATPPHAGPVTGADGSGQANSAGGGT